MAVGDSEGRVWIYDTGEVGTIFNSFLKKNKKVSQNKKESKLPGIDKR